MAAVVTVEGGTGATGRVVVRGRAAGVGAKLAATVSVLMLTVLAVAVIGAVGLNRTHQDATVLTDQRLRAIKDSAALSSGLFALHETALKQLETGSAEEDDALGTELDQKLLPGFNAAVLTLEQDFADNPERLAVVQRLRAGMASYLRLRVERFTAAGKGGRVRADAATRAELVGRTDALFESMLASADSLVIQEAAGADLVKHEADDTYRSTLVRLAFGVLVALAVGLLASVMLARNLLPRIRGYSRFAADVAAGRPTLDLWLRGSDELTELGRALTAMVDQRHRQVADDHAQTEFVETLQVTSGEDEAQDLVKRHLERSLPGSAVVVLRRNNSANRLEPATRLEAEDPLLERLDGAEPRTCAALRLGKAHVEGPGLSPLLSCQVCSGRDQPSTCEPLLVGGEVMGAVLVSHPTLPDADREAVIRTTVTQAAPMLANLRNLALAEFRANNDALTGIPNKRATDDTLRRMVAQANRSISPLAAVMLDLDHFKQINDRYGHGKGDEVLAAVGAAVQACLRTSDFAGRFGGEEFLILLPDTDANGALPVAERIRAAIGQLSVPGIDREITASLGIADLLRHGGTLEGLIREADRALYAAKAAGRNRTVIATEATPAATDA